MGRRGPDRSAPAGRRSALCHVEYDLGDAAIQGIRRRVRRDHAPPRLRSAVPTACSRHPPHEEGPTFSILIDKGAQSCRARRPGALLQGHQEGNGGELAGPSPVDRGKPGSKMHVLSDANGLPLRVGLSAANTHDSLGLKPMVAHFHIGHESHSDHSKPQRLHAHKAYDFPDLRRWLHSQHIGVRIARKGIDSSERLGRRRWVIERTISWLTGYRRLSPRYGRHPRNYLAFLGLAAAICCYKRLLKLTMQDTV
ncbi:IS5 family transposase [Streptomyces sp. NPDC005917]|uniref:IS5 family transposase n=1 Tax=unclassified Streptomyces TaxID=2593676 RepID=UPI0034034127